MTGAPPTGASDPDPEQLAAAVLAAPAVARLDGGRFGQTTSYLPGRRIPGVAVRPNELVVSVVGAVGCTASELSRQVRTALAPLTAGRPVRIVFADLDTEPAPAPAQAP